MDIGGVFFQFLNKLASILWGSYMLVFILIVALWVNYNAKFFQIRHFAHILKVTFRNVFKKGEGEGVISPFQAASTALAGTVGAGNIAGVATALAIGGPGAVFWMWVSALLLMILKVAECSLAIYYREKLPDGRFYGGPYYYIKKGLGEKWKSLGTLHSFFLVFGALITAAGIQPHTLGEVVEDMFNIPPLVTVTIAVVLMALVIWGGFKRIGETTEKLVPFMSLLYVIAGVILILLNITKVPSALAQIFKYAFAPAPAVGGFTGATIAATITKGVSRGAFSNEAGLGTAPMVYAQATIDDPENPVKVGIWGAFEVFVDTIVICTITALAILTTGVWSTTSAQGAALTATAFSETFGTAGRFLVDIALVLFTYSTMLGYYVEFETSLVTVFGEKVASIAKYIYLIPPFIFAGRAVLTVWAAADVFVGLLFIPNLIALALLAPKFAELLERYKKWADL